MNRGEIARRAAERVLRSAARDRQIISLAGGLPARELFPSAAVTRAVERALSTSSSLAGLQYGWPEGEPMLREWVARRLNARGACISAEDVVITAGAQQAVAIALHQIVKRGAPVYAGAECYAGALDLLRSLGAEAITDPFSLPLTAAYVMPGAANPRGDDPLAETQDVFLAAECPIVADEAYAELRFDGRLPSPLIHRARAAVWHVGTVSKTLCPGLRVGWLVPPPAQVESTRRAKQREDLQAGSFAQAVLAKLLREIDYDEHLQKARSLYASRADALTSYVWRALPDFSFVMPAGGFSIFLEHRGQTTVTELAFLRAAARNGVVFDPGSAFVAHPEPKRLAIRLSYSNANERSLREATIRLARAWDECRASPEIDLRYADSPPPSGRAA